MFHSFHEDRKNKTCQWWPTDTEEGYSPKQASCTDNYSPDDITYKFNSEGFRCDEFTDQSDFPILFMGCSLTEGTGLPLNHCWPHFLLEKIRAMPEHQNQVIPFHSIALVGTGIDTAARLLIKHIDQIKPKVIFYYCLSLFRRECSVTSNEISYWIPNQKIVELKNSPILPVINKLYSDEYYAKFKSYQSLEAINLAARLYNSTVYIVESTQPQSANFSQEFVDSLSNVVLVRSDYRAESTDSALDHLPLHARDNMHPGVRWQKALAELLWRAFTTPEFIKLNNEKILDSVENELIPAVSPPPVVTSRKMIQKTPMTKKFS